MKIVDIYDIEDCVEQNGYYRIKLLIDGESFEEKSNFLKKLVEHFNLSKEDFNVNDLTVIAYLDLFPESKTVSPEDPMISFYYKDFLEENVPDSWFTKHAFERCIEFVKELAELNGTENLNKKEIKLPKMFG